MFISTLQIIAKKCKNPTPLRINKMQYIHTIEYDSVMPHIDTHYTWMNPEIIILTERKTIEYDSIYINVWSRQIRRNRK